jgi:hypothetical protein
MALAPDIVETAPDRDSKIVATRLPADLAHEVELAAAKELISVASFARRAIMRAVRDV